MGHSLSYATSLWWVEASALFLLGWGASARGGAPDPCP